MKDKATGIWWSVFVLLVLATGCNKRDLNILGNIADDHTNRLEYLENMIIEAQRQIEVINKLLYEYDKRIQITRTVAGEEGGYHIYFSDGDSLKIDDGVTPVIEWSPENTWIINGTDTGIRAEGMDAEGDAVAPLVRIREGIWEISADNGTTWVTTGVNIRGENGSDAVAPQISVGENGNWFINGEDTGKRMAGENGVPAVSPQVDIRENGDGTSNWWIKNGTGDWEDTGVCAVGKDGEPGTDGTDAPFINNVTVAGTQVTFILSGNIPGTNPATNRITVTREVECEFTYFYDSEWQGNNGKTIRVAVGESAAVKFKLQLRNPMPGMRFDVNSTGRFEFQDIYFTSHTDLVYEGVLVVEADASLREYMSEKIMIVFIDNKGREFSFAVPFETEVFRLDVGEFEFSESDVYLVKHKGERIAEICREYLDDGTPAGVRAVVVYPFHAENLQYGNGFVMNIGGMVDYATCSYQPSGFPAGKTDLYFLSAKVILPSGQEYEGATPLAGAQITPDVLTDIQGNRYRVGKIGTQYWMLDNLRTEQYNTGEYINVVENDLLWSSQNDGAYCYYNNDKVGYKEQLGALYNRKAVETGRLAPVGWHVPDEEDWRMLEIYLGVEAGGMEQTNVYRGGKLLSDKLKSISGWADNGNGNNRTGFNAAAGGYRSETGAFSGIRELGWWWSGNYSGGRVTCRTLSSRPENGGISRSLVSPKDGHSVRCVRDF